MFYPSPNDLGGFLGNTLVQQIYGDPRYFEVQVDTIEKWT
ncbi:hypothetical protein J31TS6_22130 [Brevibacillus reuszeri]|nr:hypothetical protein J31TS6_22130 [Brevibacillus reuszeri]